MLCVVNEPIMLSVIRLSVVVPFRIANETHFKLLRWRMPMPRTTVQRIFFRFEKVEKKDFCSKKKCFLFEKKLFLFEKKM
jgi:hypothetical protein